MKWIIWHKCLWQCNHRTAWRYYWFVCYMTHTDKCMCSGANAHGGSAEGWCRMNFLYCFPVILSLTESGAHQLAGLAGRQAPGISASLYSWQSPAVELREACCQAWLLGRFWGSGRRFLRPVQQTLFPELSFQLSSLQTHYWSESSQM